MRTALRPSALSQMNRVVLCLVIITLSSRHHYTVSTLALAEPSLRAHCLATFHPFPDEPSCFNLACLVIITLSPLLPLRWVSERICTYLDVGVSFPPRVL